MYCRLVFRQSLVLTKRDTALLLRQRLANSPPLFVHTEKSCFCFFIHKRKVSVLIEDEDTLIIYVYGK